MTVSQTEYIKQDAATRVQVLSEALPYIQQFIGRTIVVKYGGAAMKDSNLKDKVIRDIVFLSCVGLRPILVHGGGPEINSWLDKLGIEAQFKNGLRVTDAPTMDVVEMVLVGRVNKEIVALINQAGGSAVGLCGKDGNLIKARPQGDEGIGFVGEVNNVNIKILETLVNNGYIPVVSSVAADETGQPYNINADTVAGEIAAALGAEKLILLTDTRGILKDYKDPSTLIPKVDIQEARELIAMDVVSGGMIPKVNCCVRSLAQGVKAAHIIDGRIPHSLLLEIFTDVGIGTMIVGSHLQMSG
ncbi:MULTISPECIES: acetylglutamate kinase [Nostocales]|uniref:Acetylglutamate kinase n=3 Tax=Nostocales TaxID=1161 RepID=A0A0C1RGZ3_9CYAN|nr:acetylglutamate kinase [Tolypothrix bouteillei]KAF3887411.1 acetylglutamate kinase [Tolypothrix bouteillei VB521301]